MTERSEAMLAVEICPFLLDDRVYFVKLDLIKIPCHGPCILLSALMTRCSERGAEIAPDQTMSEMLGCLV